MSDCLFCKIAHHDIDAHVVYEDADVIAFNDIAPVAPVHILVIPKKHFAHYCDAVPQEIYAAMAHAIQTITAENGLDKTGYRLVSNVGDDAGQEVHHLHIHILGGTKLGALDEKLISDDLS